MHWGCGASSSSTCKVYNHNGEGEFFLNICTCYNIARFLGDVSGLAEFVDDKVTVFQCYFETEMARFHHFLVDHGDSIGNDNDVHGTIKNEQKTRMKMSMTIMQVIFCRHASCWALMLPHNKWKPVAPLHQVLEINNVVAITITTS